MSRKNVLCYVFLSVYVVTQPLRATKLSVGNILARASGFSVYTSLFLIPFSTVLTYKYTHWPLIISYSLLALFSTWHNNIAQLLDICQLHTQWCKSPIAPRPKADLLHLPQVDPKEHKENIPQHIHPHQLEPLIQRDTRDSCLFHPVLTLPSTNVTAKIKTRRTSQCFSNLLMFNHICVCSQMVLRIP